MASPLDEDTLQQIYTWIDEIPLSRPKRNITRDFSDGVLVAEIIKHFLPKMIDLHNYAAASSTAQKSENWKLLSRKVFSKIGFQISQENIASTVACKPGTVEVVLKQLRDTLDEFLARKRMDEEAESLSGNPIGYEDYVQESNNYSYNPYAPQPDYLQQGMPPAQQQQLAQNYNSYNNNYNQDYINNGPAAMGGVSQPQPLPSQAPHLSSQAPLRTHQSVLQQGIPQGLLPQNSNYPNYSQQPALATYHESPRSPGNHQTQAKPSPSKAKGAGARRESKITKKQSTPQAPVTANENTPSGDLAIRLALEEKEQSLLASQETVQILNAKIRRLEHLLQLKDLRIADLSSKLQITDGMNNMNIRPPVHPPDTFPHPGHHPLPGIPRPQGGGFQR